MGRLVIAGFHMSSRSLYPRRILRNRAVRLILLVLLLVTCFDTLRVHQRIAHLDVPPPFSPALAKRERIYIASMHWNDGPLIREHWNPAILDLIKTLGRENVFLSVYESGSWDESKYELGRLDAELARRGIKRHIVIEDTTHEDEIRDNMPADGKPLPEGWISTDRAPAEMRRIPFLAKLRNRTLRDLRRLASQGKHFDKILFLNDVVFETRDVLMLLDTNNGVYAAACSLDFSDPPKFYDTFALRDANGDPHLTQTWPYFRDHKSRDAMIAHHDAVPVQSCWNGIVAMPVAPFLGPSSTVSSSATSDGALGFRAIPDSLAQRHLEASECCLIHIDNPLSSHLGVYLNPRVRVGYHLDAYAAVHPPDGGSWVSLWRIATGLWVNRILSWLTTESSTDHFIDRHLRHWGAQDDARFEPGRNCLVDEGQVLMWNGWNHV